MVTILGSALVAVSLGLWVWVGVYKSVLSGMARAYESAGIWRVDGGAGVSGLEGGEAEKGEMEVDAVQAEEEGRSKEEVVDERVLELSGRWVRTGWVRGVSEGAAVLCFGWVRLSG